MNKQRRADLQKIYDKLEKLRDDLETIRDDETEALTNMEGTGLEYTDNYQSAEQASSSLDEAVEGLDGVLSSIEDAIVQ